VRTLQDIQDFIGDKPIVIIGNKEPVREKEYKDVIVFRMNLGYRDDHDVWINNLSEAGIKKENLDNVPRNQDDIPHRRFCFYLLGNQQPRE